MLWEVWAFTHPKKLIFHPKQNKQNKQNKTKQNKQNKAPNCPTASTTLAALIAADSAYALTVTMAKPSSLGGYNPQYDAVLRDVDGVPVSGVGIQTFPSTGTTAVRFPAVSGTFTVPKVAGSATTDKRHAFVVEIIAKNVGLKGETVCRSAAPTPSCTCAKSSAAATNCTGPAAIITSPPGTPDLNSLVKATIELQANAAVNVSYANQTAPARFYGASLYKTADGAAIAAAALPDGAGVSEAKPEVANYLPSAVVTFPDDGAPYYAGLSVAASEFMYAVGLAAKCAPTTALPVNAVRCCWGVAVCVWCVFD